MDPAEVLMREAEALVAQQFRDRTIAQIAAAIERELRAGGPPLLPRSEEAARRLLRALGAELQQAGEALERAAYVLKEQAHLPTAASQAHQAARKALSTARELTT